MSHLTPNAAAQVSLIPQSPGEVAKAITYIALTALGIWQAASADSVISTTEVIAFAVAIVGTVPVYLLSGTAVKTVAAFVLAALQALTLALGDDLGLGQVTTATWIGVVFAAFAAIGIAVVPNTPAKVATINRDGSYNVSSLVNTPASEPTPVAVTEVAIK